MFYFSIHFVRTSSVFRVEKLFLFRIPHTHSLSMRFVISLRHLRTFCQLVCLSLHHCALTASSFHLFPLDEYLSVSVQARLVNVNITFRIICLMFLFLPHYFFPSTRLHDAVFSCQWWIVMIEIYYEYAERTPLQAHLHTGTYQSRALPHTHTLTQIHPIKGGNAKTLKAKRKIKISLKITYIKPVSRGIKMENCFKLK